MTIWTKMSTLLRASAHEPVERLVDANALRIMTQELKDSEQVMWRAKRELAGLMAHRRQLERQDNDLAQRITTREQQATMALDKGEDSLAFDLAARIADDETQRKEQRLHLDQLAKREQSLRDGLHDAAQSLQYYNRELSLAKAQQSGTQFNRRLEVQGISLRDSLDELAQSLEHIKTRQTHQADVQDALRELDREAGGHALELRLRETGIATGQHDATAVLQRLKATSTSSGTSNLPR